MSQAVKEEVTNRAAKSARLEALEKQAEKIRQQIADIEAKQNARARKDDTREKVIVGAAILANVKINPETRAGVADVLEKAVTAPRDREFLKGRGWL
jgi:hypothetical protein